MKPGTLLRLALAGTRTDTLRVVFTAGSAALATIVLLAAATLAALPDLGKTPTGALIQNPGYSHRLISDPGVRGDLISGLLLLTIPLLVLAGQCIRFGSPDRDRRLSAIRLVGATPRQIVVIAGVETGLATTAGVLAAGGLFLATRALLHDPGPDGRLPLPTDVLPTASGTLAVVFGVPLVAGLISTFLLRYVILTPLGIVRRTRDRRPRLWPLGLVVLGVVAPYAVPAVLDEIEFWLLEQEWFLTMSWNPYDEIQFGLVLTAVIGVVVGTGCVTYNTGRWLLRWGRRPAMLIAARQLLADPWNGSRTFAALLASLVVGSAGFGYAGYLEGDFQVHTEVAAFLREPVEDRVASGLDFRLGVLDLITTTTMVTVAVAAVGILVALAESIVSRRRAYAALVATGVSRRTLAEAVAWQTLVPLVPTILLALAVGLNLPRSMATSVSAGGGPYERCVGTAAQCAESGSRYLQEVQVPEFSQGVPVPLADLALLGAGALLAMLGVVAIGILVLRRSTDLEELRAG